MVEGEATLHRDDVAGIVASHCFPERDDPSPGRVGLEVERFAIRAGADGSPHGRLSIGEGSPAVLDVLDTVADAGQLEPRATVDGVPSYPVPGGGRLTFEPGGVVEHATAVHDTARGALDEIERIGPPLGEAFDEHGVLLASAGVDPFHNVAEIPLQLDCFRYPAMAAYFDRRGSAGRIIMRHSCSVQVNLDLGTGRRPRTERWLVANLVAPLVTATFANSPSGSRVCARALAWQEVDPTRTGFAPTLWRGEADAPVDQMVDAALRADVMLVRTGNDSAVPGAPGWTFGAWLRDGHADHGPPSSHDLEYHLTTIFHEVRPRGMLEIRGVDAVPQRWRSVPVTLLTGAVEDVAARRRIVELLDRHRGSLPEMWRTAAHAGVGDPAFCALTVEAWSYAMEGASRLPAGYLPDDALVVAEEFLERYTLRGRCPADDLRHALRESPAAALASVAEPVPERAGWS